MFRRRHLPWLLALTLFVPVLASAQVRSQPQGVPGYQQGYERGLRTGADDFRRGSPFNFSISLDFRRGDLGYDVRFGNRSRSRADFRRGFEVGYRAGYGNRGRIERGRPGRVAPSRGPRGPIGRVDVAVQQGYSDGYEEGLKDGDDRKPFNPVRESRYRSADRGYNRSYGPKDVYKANYRNGFMRGYEEGYRDGARYERYDRRW